MFLFKYTIIIPHKNIPDLLHRCLLSIPDRKDTQVVVIDDNSTNKPQLCKFKETSVEYINLTENKGAGYARNIGLKEAKGQWILFADADDFFTEEAFDVFDDHCSDAEDLIYFRSISKYSETLLPAARNLYILEILDNHKKRMTTHSLNLVKYRVVGPPAKMIKKELINKYNIKFDEVQASNDVMFSIKTAYYAGDSVKVLEDIVYCMTTREGSLTQTHNFPIFLCRYNVTLSVNDFLKKNNQAKYCFSLLRYIIKSAQYGIFKPFQLTFLAMKLRNNIFSNCFSKYR
jgi:Glycosyltransferases involved in cell wall biogenesis